MMVGDAGRAKFLGNSYEGLRMSANIASYRDLVVWQKAPIAGGEGDKLVVEAEAPDASIQGSFVLKLWAAGGTRPVTLGGVTFP